MPQGYLALILHAHLPFVRHPEHEEFLEERWLFEAITECYVPLLTSWERLVEEGVPFRLTCSLTPTLLTMLSDDLLQQRYLRHLNCLIELTDKELHRTRHEPAFHHVAQMYHDRFCHARWFFETHCRRNLITAFRALRDAGRLELITCGATHGYLPLMEMYPSAVRAQVQMGVATHTRLLGEPPRGIWLPECGYQPDHDAILRDSQLRFCITDAHGILFGSPRPKYGVYAPVYCPSGVAAFGRDPESSKSVWSAVEGYPGDYEYREFYRDIGFDVDYDYIRPYLNGDGGRINTGIKYYRITGATSHKEPYVPERARDKAAAHAGNFLFNRQRQAEYLHRVMGKPPIIVSPYDAELYGHWWFEGPEWLDFLIRKIACDQDTLELITPSQYLERFPRHQVITPSLSSWGYQGYSEMWLCSENAWIYRHLHAATERMVTLATHAQNGHALTGRALNQMGRELLLAQSSDWAFILKTGSFTSYATRRITEHLDRFQRLEGQVRSDTVDAQFLGWLEHTDHVFPELDYHLYADSRR